MKKQISQTAKKDILFGCMLIFISILFSNVSPFSLFLSVGGGMLLGGGLREAGIWT